MPLVNNGNDGILTIGGISMNPTNGAWGIVGHERGEGSAWASWHAQDAPRRRP